MKKYDGIIRERTVHACVDRSFNRTIQMWLCSKLMPMKQMFVLFGYRIYNHNHNHKFINQLTQRVTSGLQL